MMAVDVWRMNGARLGLGTWLMTGACTALAGRVTPAHSRSPQASSARRSRSSSNRRDRLDEAATQVAELTRKLYGDPRRRMSCASLAGVARRDDRHQHRI